MNISHIFSFARQSVNLGLSRNISLSASCKFIQFTPCLGAEPLKKKKKLDPAVVKHREERRKKKMEKQIRRLEKNQRQLKPIGEIEVPLELIDGKEIRKRPNIISPEKLEEFALLEKQWARYKSKKVLSDIQMLERINNSQSVALNELRLTSEDLYQAAVRIDENLLPFIISGPTDTPPVENYNSPDGEYTDISKKWQ